MIMKQQEDEEVIKIGLLGKLFGVGPHTGKNIAGIIAVLSLVVGCIVSSIIILMSKEQPYAIWTFIAPALTGALGYLFGTSK